MSKYVTVSTTNTWDTKYATVSNTWAIKDTVTSYFTKCTLCSGRGGQIMKNTKAPPVHNVYFVKYDNTVFFMVQVLDTVTYFVSHVLVVDTVTYFDIFR